MSDQENGRLLDANTNAAGFDQLWKERHGEFTAGISDTTPLLETFIAYRRSVNGSRKIVEVGPGQGFHALRLGLEGFSVVGVEHSSDAIVLAEENKTKIHIETGRQVDVAFVQGDMTEYCEAVVDEDWDLYGNLALHVKGADDRRRIYRAAPRLAAVSFKTINDSLRWKGRMVGEDQAGVIVNDEKYGNYGISRLLVSHPEYLVDEAREEGLDLVASHVWRKEGYNDGQDSVAEIIGFLFERRRK